MSIVDNIRIKQDFRPDGYEFEVVEKEGHRDVDATVASAQEGVFGAASANGQVDEAAVMQQQRIADGVGPPHILDFAVGVVRGASGEGHRRVHGLAPS